MAYDDDFDDSEFEEPVLDEPVVVPETLKLTLQVGLTDYIPSSLLNLIAAALVREIGGRDHWAAMLNAYLLRLGKDRAESLVSAEVERIMRDGIGALDLGAIVQKAAEGWAATPVRKSDGAEAKEHYDRQNSMPRLEWFVGNLVREAMTAAWKTAEAEWKAATQAAIKSTLMEAMAEKLAKALPAPPELR